MEGAKLRKRLITAVTLCSARLCLKGCLNLTAEVHPMSTENAKPAGFSSVFKIFLFALPPTLVSEFSPHGHHVLYGASLVLGALLQAVIPPHMYRFWWILGTACAGAIISPFILRFFGN
jgi:hypothetical protein